MPMPDYLANIWIYLSWILAIGVPVILVVVLYRRLINQASRLQIRYLSPAQKAILQQGGLAFQEVNQPANKSPTELLNLNSPMSSNSTIVFAATELSHVTHLLRAEIISRFRASSLGHTPIVDELILHYQPDADPSLAQFRVTADNAFASDGEQVLAAVREIVLPVVRKNIVVHNGMGITCAPIEDGAFHVFLNCPPRSSARAQGSTASVWHAPVNHTLSLFGWAELGLPFRDESHGFVMAELVGENNLYLLADFWEDRLDRQRGFFTRLWYALKQRRRGRNIRLGTLTRVLQRCQEELRYEGYLNETLSVLRADGKTREPLPRPLNNDDVNVRRREIVSSLVEHILPVFSGSELRITHQLGPYNPDLVDKDFNVVFCPSAPGYEEPASPITRARRREPAAETKKDLFLRSKRGLPVTEKGVVIGEIYNRQVLYLHPDLIKYGSRAETLRLARILISVRDQFQAADAWLQEMIKQASSLVAEGTPLRKVSESQGEKTWRAEVVKMLVQHLLSPHLDKEICIHFDCSGNPGRRPENDGKFHLFLGPNPIFVGSSLLPPGLPMLDEFGRDFALLFNHSNVFFRSAPVASGTKQEAELFYGQLQRLVSQLVPVDRQLDEIVRKLKSEGLLAEPPLAKLGRKTKYEVADDAGQETWKVEVVRAVVDRILLPLVGANIRINHCGGRLRPPLADGNFHIFLHASPQTTPLPFLEAPSSIYGHTLAAASRAAYMPSALGIPITDSSTGFVIGEIVKQNLYLYLDLIPRGYPSEIALLARTFAQAYQEFVASSNGRALDERLKGQLSAECIRQSLEVDKSSVQADSLEEAQQGLRLGLGKVLGAQKDYLRTEATPEEELGREFDGLSRIKKVTGVQMKNDALVVSTENLYCVDPRTSSRHEIGAFEISIPTEPDKPVLWINQTYKIDGGNTGMNAPHVNAKGLACLGNMKEIFPMLITKRDFGAAIEAAIAFIESVNVDDNWGVHIDKWPLAS